jgi:biopolymer transport protein ExbD
MNYAQVRAKARRAVARRAEVTEQEEIETGEINLIPYLDIVTNLLLFLLVSVSAGYVLGQINTTLPDHAPAAAAAQPVDPKKHPDEQSLQLIVAVTKTRVLLWSMTGLEGTAAAPKAVAARLPAVEGEPARYELEKINAALYEIAARRWKGKPRARQTYEVILMADGSVAYDTIIATMDALRRKLPEPGKPDGFLGMPKEANRGTEARPDLVPVEPFDPDVHYLFPDILFSKSSFE